MNIQTHPILAAVVAFCVSPLLADSKEFHVSIQVDLGADVGQNFGTLFEAVDEEGQVIAGAGYLGSYNTQARSDRRLLHFYVKPEAQPAFKPRRLPRVNDDTGTYLFEFDDQLFAKGRGGRDPKLRRWDGPAQQWREDPDTRPFSVQIGDGVLSSNARGIQYNARPVLTIKPDQGSLAERYYASGHLVFRRYDRNTDPPVNELVACPWTAGDPAPASLQKGHAIQMGTPREFVYAYGQLNDQIVAATNTGGVYVFDTQSWKTLLEPDIHISFQIYTMINYRDRLLMGQYPTGELFAYDGKTLKHLSDWPPAMSGVQKRAREAQTLTIYGGDLYAGVWPWAEVWKYGNARQGWKFLGRMFTHPAPTTETTHPYERETTKLGSVLNRWGQRVTSLVPLGDALFISTSSKGGTPFEPKFAFLAPDKWKDYGAVYEHRQPGALAVHTKWVNGPTTFKFEVRNRQMTVDQDGRRLGTARAPRDLSSESSKITYRRGVFGPFRGKSINPNHQAASHHPDRPFLGAYIDMHHCFDPRADRDVAIQAIDENLDRFRAAGLNVIIPKATTTAGRANYPSTIMAKRTYPDWDPLSHFVKGGRQRNLSVWPAVCVLACGHDKPTGILLEHPEWALRDPEGRPIGSISPGHPQARAWVVSILEEVVRQYNPDGLLLDYLRYNNRPGQLDAVSAARFEREIASAGDLDAEQRSKKLQTFRETLLTELMVQIHDSLRKIKPDLKLAIYSWGPHVIENHRVGQDWRTWVQRGYIDMINVSGYLYPEQNGEDYLKAFQEKMTLAKSIVADTGRSIPVTFALGVRTSHGEVHSAEQIGEYLQAARRADLDGVAFFTWSYLRPYLDQVVRTHSLADFASRQ